MSADPDVIEAALRSITDCGDREFYEAIKERQGRFIKAGALGSGRAEICQSEDLAKLFKERAEAAVAKIQRARDVVPGEHVHQLRHALETLRGRILEWRRNNVARSGGFSKSPALVQRVVGQLEDDMNKAIEDAVRDAEHFHPAAQGVKQGNVIVTGNTGNTNVAAGTNAKAAQQVGADLVRLADIMYQARRELTAAPDSPAKIEALDQIEVIETKIRENAPKDQLVRWAKRSLETCEKVGVATVGPLIAAWLKSQGF